MPQSIEFQKQMTEIVYINLPGPREPEAGMSGGELFHGFLAELYRTPLAGMKTDMNKLCSKWNVFYVEHKE
jgi:hypothetical protein